MNTNHIPTEAEKLIDRIFTAVTNEEACAEAIIAEVGELLSSYRKEASHD